MKESVEMESGNCTIRKKNSLEEGNKTHTTDLCVMTKGSVCQITGQNGAKLWNILRSSLFVVNFFSQQVSLCMGRLTNIRPASKGRD